MMGEVRLHLTCRGETYSLLPTSYNGLCRRAFATCRAMYGPVRAEDGLHASPTPSATRQQNMRAPPPASFPTITFLLRSSRLQDLSNPYPSLLSFRRGDDRIDMVQPFFLTHQHPFSITSVSTHDSSIRNDCLAVHLLERLL
jgi:hypothetical protein